ncbi:MAG: hypothetical protein ACOYA9_06320 [Bilifractor sp.]
MKDGRGWERVLSEQKWYRLDNAAKIIPSSVGGADTRVFRLVCELNEEVDPSVLQQALDQALTAFPYMNCCLRKGIFWYYMSELDHGAVVHEEYTRALKSLYVPGRRNLLYRVVYRKNRIILEMFHVLADGTGGFMFFRAIITEYLVLKHHLDRGLVAGEETAASIEELRDDAFSRYYEKNKSRKRNFLKEMFPKTAYRLKGTFDENMDAHLIEGTASTKQILGICHERKVTLGVLITSVWIESIVKQMKRSEYGHPVVVSVPVNLRQFFPTETSRNFFGVINVSFDPGKYDGTLESILPVVKEEFNNMLKPENVQATMNSYSDLEHNAGIRPIPLVFKDIGLRTAMSMMNHGVTTSVSNVGKVDIPEQLHPYIHKFCSFMACKTVFMCISTFEDCMVFGIVSAFEEHTTEMFFFRRLVELGADIEIASNDNFA